MNIAFYWPIAFLVIFNVTYHLSSKEAPENINTFAFLTISYIISAAFSFIFYLLSDKEGSFINNIQHINWATFVMGISMVGLEIGAIYMYKVGWNLNSGQVLYSSVLAVVLFIIGTLFYKEPFSISKIAGIAVCLFGIFLINK